MNDSHGGWDRPPLRGPAADHDHLDHLTATELILAYTTADNADAVIDALDARLGQAGR